MAVEVGDFAQCVLHPGGTPHAVSCTAGRNPDGGWSHEVGPFEGQNAESLTLRILYSASDRTFAFFVDDMSTGHTIVLGEDEFGTYGVREDRQIIVRVHDLSEPAGGVDGSVDWIEFEHLADDEVVV